jgi:hypothetical protein
MTLETLTYEVWALCVGFPARYGIEGPAQDKSNATLQVL